MLTTFRCGTSFFRYWVRFGMTPMSAWYWGRPEIEEPFLRAMPLGRWATEDEIAAPIVFLLGDGASMISGVCLPIDGGFTAQ